MLPLAARIVEVIADLGQEAKPRYRYGSGCIVGGRTVITAGHVVAGARTVNVRRLDKIPLSVRVDAEFVSNEDGPDLALIEIDDPSIDLPLITLAQVNRNTDTAAPVEGCHAVGFPQFAERIAGSVVRDTVDAWGHIPVLSKLDDGMLTVQVTAAPRPLPPEGTALGKSEWSGMSGAPVVADGCLVGVVSEHARREGPSAITAVPLTSLERDSAHLRWGPGVANSDAWWARLGVSGPAELRKLPTMKARPEPVYRATVRTIHERTPQLLGRGKELADFADFATGNNAYRWMVGEVWAGKTALVAEAVIAALPPSVDAVAYFLSPSEADADSSRFLAAVVPQLAYILDIDSPVIDLHQFRDLWYRASKRAVETGRHLLLLVDGLDEDLRPNGLPSVASLLPARMGASTHLLVTTRLRPEVDLLEGHCLLAEEPVVLKPSPYKPNPIPAKLVDLIRARILAVRRIRPFYIANSNSQYTGVPENFLKRHRLDPGEEIVAVWRLGAALNWGNSDNVAFTTSRISIATKKAHSIPYSRFVEFEFRERSEVKKYRDGSDSYSSLEIEGPGISWVSPGYGPWIRLGEPIQISSCLNAIKKLTINHAEKILNSSDRS